MKKMNVKVVAGVLAASMCLGLCACGNTQTPDPSKQIEDALGDLKNELEDALKEATDEIKDAAEDVVEDIQTGMPNPMTEVDADGLLNAPGIEMPLPEGATDVKYFVIETGEGFKVGEAQFTLNGMPCSYRCKTTDVTSIDAAEDISGMYMGEDAVKTAVQVSGRDGYAVTDANMGYVEFLDIVPGIVYALDVTSPVSADELVYMAEQIFVCVQGDN